MNPIRSLVLGLLIAWLSAGDEPLPTALLKPGDTILCYGNSLIERVLEHGECEALIQLATPGRGLLNRPTWGASEFCSSVERRLPAIRP